MTVTCPSLPSSIRFVEPMPGLDAYDLFDVTQVDDAGFVFALRAVDADRPVRLFAVAANAFFPGYAPVLPEQVHAQVGPAPVVLVLTCAPAQDGEPPTANLLAPLAVDATTGIAVQAVLDGDWPLRAPLAA